MIMFEYVIEDEQTQELLSIGMYLTTKLPNIIYIVIHALSSIIVDELCIQMYDSGTLYQYMLLLFTKVISTLN